MPGKTRILILGGGFGGAYCAQHLERMLRWRPDLADRVEIILIDRNNYFIFSPLLVETGTGSIQPTHAVVGLRRAEYLSDSYDGPVLPAKEPAEA